MTVKFSDGTVIEFETKEPWAQYSTHHEWFKLKAELAIKIQNEQKR